MPRRSTRVCLSAFLLLAATPFVLPAGPAPGLFSPDPASVERSGPGYRFPQAGWIVLHIEGEPYERGWQHGELLAQEIAEYLGRLAAARSPKAPGDAWRDLRMACDALFLRRYEREYLEEMKGIADGAAHAGAKLDGRPLDLLDIVTINSGIELDFLESSLAATPTGLEGTRFREPPYARPARKPPEHCSAFAATGPATADGKVVFGHITMWTLYVVKHFNVWLDIKPSQGHRVVLQTFPGGIMSGLDYYQNDAGILVAETTIAQTGFDIDGLPVCLRIRKALQYSDTIDAAVETLVERNNGLYSNEWLLADTKTNEIAMLELGTHKHRLWRSGKKEWFAGTEGFYFGCNNAKDLQVRLETKPGVDGKPHGMVFRPSDRDLKWLRLYEKHKGKIDASFGFEAFGTAPLCAYPSCDAKFTTSDLAREMRSWGIFGPPLGRTWEPTVEESLRNPDITPLVANDWALLTPLSTGPVSISPPPPSQAAAVDLAPSWQRKQAMDPTAEDALLGDLPAAWRGTILPAADADIWLAVGFAGYERIVALEKALTLRAKDGKLSEADREKLDLALFAPRSAYLMARERLGKEIPPAETRADLKSNAWYDLAAGKGVLMLAALRRRLGAEAFDGAMDEFGRAHAGKPVSTAEFRAHLEKRTGASLEDFIKRCYLGTEIEQGGEGARPRGLWSVEAFEEDPDGSVIVYGTIVDAHAQREAAERLQRQIARRWCNCLVELRSDREATSEDLKDRHVLLVGTPRTNAAAGRMTEGLAVTFGPGSFQLKGRTYANPRSAVVVAGPNPLNPRRSVVIFAGLSADATWRSVEALGASRDKTIPAEAILLEADLPPRRLALPWKGAGLLFD